MIPKVSVLMACYNARQFVQSALESVHAQSYPNYELVVVDDGSTDGTSAIVESCLGNRGKLVRQENRGAASARNVAFEHASGDFVLFLDADDLISNSHISALMARATEAPNCIALSRWDRFRTDRSEAAFPPRVTERDLPGPDWLELDWRDARPMTQSGMLLLPRTLLETYGGWDVRLTLQDDFEFFARMVAQCSGIRFAPNAALFYRSAVPGSLSSRNSRAAVESAFLSVDLGINHLLAAKNTTSTRRVCANLLQDFEYRYFPHHADLRKRAREQASLLGGADLPPDGPPGFHRLRKFTGWKPARLAQRAVEKMRRSLTRGRAHSI